MFHALVGGAHYYFNFDTSDNDPRYNVIGSWHHAAHSYSSLHYSGPYYYVIFDHLFFDGFCPSAMYTNFDGSNWQFYKTMANTVDIMFKEFRIFNSMRTP